MDDWLVAGAIADWAGKFGPIRAWLAGEQFWGVFVHYRWEISFDQFNDPFGGAADRRQGSGEHFRRDIVGSQVERTAMMNSKMREHDERGGLRLKFRCWRVVFFRVSACL